MFHDKFFELKRLISSTVNQKFVIFINSSKIFKIKANPYFQSNDSVSYGKFHKIYNIF